MPRSLAFQNSSIGVFIISRSGLETIIPLLVRQPIPLYLARRRARQVMTRFSAPTQFQQGITDGVSRLCQLSIGDNLLPVVYDGFFRATFREVTVEKEGSEIKFLRHNGR
jgi:hypothetical protein